MCKAIRKIIYLLILFLYCNCKGQTNIEYKVGVIPYVAEFEKMTEHEIKIDTNRFIHKTEEIKRMEDGTGFIDGVSDEIKQRMIKYTKIHNQRYKDNRSRYYLEQFINDKKDVREFNVDTITSDCQCYLNNDTIKISMFSWSNFAIDIIIYKNYFNSTYRTITHKEPVNKKELNDTDFVDNLIVSNEQQNLILETQPSFSIGEKLLGYLIFKTNKYYRAKEYEMGVEPDFNYSENMQNIFIKGSLHFKCISREKTIGDK
ncbi:MAG: hypothetical protein JWN78_497 [Bacteroidota bacterium]|nr:hypothetical protein [Bacteroidota bacterium]